MSACTVLRGVVMSAKMCQEGPYHMSGPSDAPAATLYVQPLDGITSIMGC